MKRTKLTFVALFACLFSGSLSAQIIAGDGFIMSESIEVGFGSNGAEGSANLPPMPNHARAFTPRLGIVANQLNDGWTNYNGDYSMPGAPEMRFGIEVDGVTYANSSMGVNEITSYGLSNFMEADGCTFMDWDGSVAGIDIHQSFKHDSTEHFYTVQVTLTNTTAFDKSDVFFFKSLDPDNNQSIFWGFATENEVEKQPAGECPIALVSATDNEAWDSYIALGGMGEDIRVATGGFFVNDASAVWDGTGPYNGTVGEKEFADQAIAVCHKDDVIPAGESTTFEFVVIMKKSEANEALMNLAHFMDDDFFTFWYDDGDDIADEEPIFTETCSDAYAPILMGGILYVSDGIPDTLRRCTEDESMLIVTTPDSDPEVVSPYNIEWMEATGEDTLSYASETDTVIIPATLPDTVTYLCFVGAAPCLGVGYGVVHEYTVITIQTPEIIITDPGVLCQDSLLLTDIEVVDSFEVEGTETSYHVTMPENAEDDSDLWPSDYAHDGDSVYIMIATTETGCYDVELVHINLSPLNAGADGSAPAVCNNDAAGVNLNDYLDGEAEDIAGVWESEMASGSIAIDSETGTFTALDLPAGIYNYYYIVGGDPCPLDTAIITIEVMNFNSAGEDGITELCSAPGLSVNLNDLLDGNDAVGTWEEITATGGAFDPATGVLDASDLEIGYYTYNYTVTSVSPCEDDVATFTVSVVPGPTASFTFTPGSVFTDDSEVTFTNTSLDATSFEWNFGDDSPISVEENPVHTYPAVAGIYEINLRVENDLGCADSLAAFIKVKEVVTFYIPNTFTPDGNAKNDNFLPVFESGFDPYNFHMLVYNRYGEVVFESYDASAGWDGTFGTEGIVQGGTYTWSIEFKELDTDKIQQHKGHVTILK